MFKYITELEIIAAGMEAIRDTLAVLFEILSSDDYGGYAKRDASIAYLGMIELDNLIKQNEAVCEALSSMEKVKKLA